MGFKGGSDCGEVTAERLGRALIGDDADGAKWGRPISEGVCAGWVRNREKGRTPGGLLWLLGQMSSAWPSTVFLSFFFF